MSDDFNPKEVLDKHLKHSSTLGEIEVDFSIKALECGFPSIERYKYLKAGVGNLMVIAARPGNGKTALACQIGLNVSERGKVLFFSLEMAASEIKRRLLGNTAKAPIDKLNEPVFREKVERAQAELASRKFHINAGRGLTADDIISKVYDENSREPLALVIIDYIGLVETPGLSRPEGIKKAAIAFKHKIADHLHIPVIILAQMTRSFDDRVMRARMEYEKAKQYKNSEANEELLNVRPCMADLAESSGIEHAVDIAMFLQRSYLMNRSSSKNDFQVFVEKARSGEVEDFKLDFTGSQMRFVDKGGEDI